MIPKTTQHQTYILRIWYVKRNGQLMPVAMLEDFGRGESQEPDRQAFPSLEALFDFLQSQSRLSEPTDPPDETM